jgi:hypothetical protein
MFKASVEKQAVEKTRVDNQAAEAKRVFQQQLDSKELETLPGFPANYLVKEGD